MNKIITDPILLEQCCQEIGSLEEAQQIANNLFNILETSKGGIGLAANQINIFKSVCIINVWRPLWFMNPKMIPNTEEKIEFEEGCLSFPNQSVRTLRYKSVLVKADNLEKELHFGPWNMLECICVQHEICHLNGETMFDYTI
tara:strand:+ start:7641 stop:8069 length:429 start_codon:yes stop_codon:yes gene_type:complete